MKKENLPILFFASAIVFLLVALIYWIVAAILGLGEQYPSFIAGAFGLISAWIQNYLSKQNNSMLMRKQNEIQAKQSAYQSILPEFESTSDNRRPSEQLKKVYYSVIAFGGTNVIEKLIETIGHAKRMSGQDEEEKRELKNKINEVLVEIRRDCVLDFNKEAEEKFRSILLKEL